MANQTFVEVVQQLAEPFIPQFPKELFLQSINQYFFMAQVASLQDFSKQFRTHFHFHIQLHVHQKHVLTPLI